MICVQWKPACLSLLLLSMHQLNICNVIICLFKLYLQTSANECFTATMVQRKSHTRNRCISFTFWLFKTSLTWIKRKRLPRLPNLL